MGQVAVLGPRHRTVVGATGEPPHDQQRRAGRDLERAGVVARARVGRRNHYLVCREQRLRHAVESGVTVGQFVDLVQQGSDGSEPEQPARWLATGSTEASAERPGDWASAGHEVVAHLRSQSL